MLLLKREAGVSVYLQKGAILSGTIAAERPYGTRYSNPARRQWLGRFEFDRLEFADRLPSGSVLANFACVGQRGLPGHQSADQCPSFYLLWLNCKPRKPRRGCSVRPSHPATKGRCVRGGSDTHRPSLAPGSTRIACGHAFRSKHVVRK